MKRLLGHYKRSGWRGNPFPDRPVNPSSPTRYARRMADSYRLVLLRHGESAWNAKNLFTGWVDVDLTAQGEEEAIRGGKLLAERGLLPDVLHTSVLRRAIRTSQLALN